MKERRINDFMVGVVVLVGIVAIVAATLWVQESDLSGQRRGVEARFRDVGNAAVGSAVVVRGVRSGTIDAMELEDEGWVSVRLRLDEGVNLPPDPVVILSQASLFGEWQATITERSAVPADRELRRQLAEAEAAAPGVLPGATLPDIAQLTAVAGRIAGDVASVADRVQLAFDDSAARELRGTIHDFSVLSATLAQSVRQQSRNLDRITSQVSGGVGELSAAAATVRQVAERVDSSTTEGEINKIVMDASAAAEQLRVAATQLRTLSGQLATTQASLDSAIASANSVTAKIDRGEGSLGRMVNDPSLYTQSDSLVRSLRELVEDFRRNPRRYVNLRIF